MNPVEKFKEDVASLQEIIFWLEASDTTAHLWRAVAKKAEEIAENARLQAKIWGNLGV